MEAVPVKLVPRGYGETERQDAWWIEAILVVVVFSSFLGYGTWAAMQNEHFEFGPYLSPFYSPLLFGESHHAWFGPRPDWFPLALFSPALLILPFPGLFRFTCYYYRGAYYKAFWQDPVSCAVGEPRGTSYWGERWFPLVLQNVHRYFAYARGALHRHPVVRRLAGAVVAEPGDRSDRVRHRRRHAGDARRTCCSSPATRSAATRCGTCSAAARTRSRRRRSARPATGCSSALNGRHMLFAWCSLFSVGLTDVYIRLCSMGVLTDLRIL